MARKVDVLIAGAGPAGMSTALHLVQHSPEWAERVVVVDKAIFPRHKLCGGGLSLFAIEILEKLGLHLDIPFVNVNQLQLVLGDRTYIVAEESLLHIVSRYEFDHWLVQQGIERGIEINQGEAVVEVNTEPELQVITTKEIYLPKALVVADGSNSFIKRQLHWPRHKVARLLEILTPASFDEAAFRDGVATFDFTPTRNGLQGYYWDFPSLVQGRATMNRGVYDSRVLPSLPRVQLKQEFQRQLIARGLDPAAYPIKGHPIHLFDPASEFSRPHILLVGDAAGVDPLFGEGLPASLAYGDVAAAEIVAGCGSKITLTLWLTKIEFYVIIVYGSFGAAIWLRDFSIDWPPGPSWPNSCGN